MLAGAKVAVTPAGNPVADSAIADLNPPDPVVVTESVLGVPAVSVAAVVLGVSVKLFTATLKAREAVCVFPPPAPVIVIVDALAAALLAALIVAVTGADDVIVADENFTVTPVGAPLAVRVAGELKPPCAISVIVKFEELAGATITLERFVESVKVDWLASFQ